MTSSESTNLEEVKVNLDQSSYIEFKRRVSKAGLDEVTTPDFTQKYAKIFSTQNNGGSDSVTRVSFRRSLSASPKLEQLNTLSLFPNQISSTSVQSSPLNLKQNIIEEKRTFFNGYLVIERVYAPEVEVQQEPSQNKRSDSIFDIEIHAKKTNLKEEIHPWYVQHKNKAPMNAYSARDGSFGLGTFFLFGIIFTAIVCSFFIVFYYAGD